jgi:hypothetical protein
MNQFAAGVELRVASRKHESGNRRKANGDGKAAKTDAKGLQLGVSTKTVRMYGEEITTTQYPFCVSLGAGERSRTPDLRITNALLYQLSYTGH